METSNSSGTEILEFWAFKSDILSFFKFLKDVIFIPQTNDLNEIVFSVCKKRLISNFQKPSVRFCSQRLN
jgi:hypothetical protein